MTVHGRDAAVPPVRYHTPASGHRAGLAGGTGGRPDRERGRVLGSILWRLAGRGARRAAAPPRWLVGHVLPLDDPLLREEAFRAFWLSRLVCQTAQAALLYGLLIAVVQRTDAPFYSALFVGCSIVPSLLFGLPAGLVVDALPRRALLIALNLTRCAAVLVLVVGSRSLAWLFAVTLAIWTIHQFYSPAEGTTPAALVPRDRYGAAQALSNLALIIAQLLGLVLLAPLLLRTAGPETLFGVSAALFAGAAALAAVLPPIDVGATRGERLDAGGAPPRSARAALLNGWRAVRRDRAIFEAMADDVLVGVGLSALVVIMPFYLERVLGTAKENTVFVFAPSALGLVLGLRAAPWIGRAIDERRAATAALVGFAACVFGLGFVEQVGTLLDDRLGVPLDRIGDALGIPRLVLVAMLISIPAGFGSAVVGVAARAVLLARTPPASRGQVVATQGVLGNLGALVPTLLAGLAADWLGIRAIAVAIAVVIVGGALAARTLGRADAI